MAPAELRPGPGVDLLFDNFPEILPPCGQLINNSAATLSI